MRDNAHEVEQMQAQAEARGLAYSIDLTVTARHDGNRWQPGHAGGRPRSWNRCCAGPLREPGLRARSGATRSPTPSGPATAPGATAPSPPRATSSRASSVPLVAGQHPPAAVRRDLAVVAGVPVDPGAAAGRTTPPARPAATSPGAPGSGARPSPTAALTPGPIRWSARAPRSPTSWPNELHPASRGASAFSLVPSRLSCPVDRRRRDRPVPRNARSSFRVDLLRKRWPWSVPRPG